MSDQLFQVDATLSFFARIPEDELAGDDAADKIGDEIERVLQSSATTFADVGVFASSFDVTDWNSVPVSGEDPE